MKNTFHLLVMCCLCTWLSAQALKGQSEKGPDFVALKGSALPPLEDPEYLRLHKIKRVRKAIFFDPAMDIPEREAREVMVNGRKAHLVLDESFDRQGRQTAHVYFGSEGLIHWRSEFRYDDQGRLLEQEGEWPGDPRTLKRRRYAEDGRLEYILVSEIWENYGKGEWDQLPNTTCCDTIHFSYDAAGREISNTYFERGEVKEQHAYERDSLGRVIEEKAYFNYQTQQKREIHYEYDSLGRIVRKVELELPMQRPWKLREEVSEFEYDERGFLVFSRRENERYIDETVYHYDENGLFQGSGKITGNEVWLYDFWE